MAQAPAYDEGSLLHHVRRMGGPHPRNKKVPQPLSGGVRHTGSTGLWGGTKTAWNLCCEMAITGGPVACGIGAPHSGVGVGVAVNVAVDDGDGGGTGSRLDDMLRARGWSICQRNTAARLQHAGWRVQDGEVTEVLGAQEVPASWRYYRV